MLFNNNVKLIILVVLVVLLIVMLNNNDNQQSQVGQQQQQYMASNPVLVEDFTQHQAAQQQAIQQQQVAQQQAIQQQQVAQQQARQQQVAQQQKSVTQQNMEKLAQQNSEKQQQYSCNDYLPQEINNDWFETDLNNAQVTCDDKSLIIADRYVTGVDTVGQSLKNASYDIRAQPPCPKFNVSPWNNSTIEPDFNIKPMWDTN